MKRKAPARKAPCYNNVTPLPGHGTTDGRVNLNIYLEPQGWDSDAIRTRVQNAITCAATEWGRARGADINTRIPYNLQTTGERTQSDTVIQRGLAVGGCGENNAGDVRDTIDLDTAAQHLDDRELCLLVAHEIGHSLGLDNETRDCFSIMGPALDDGSCRSDVQSQAIQPNDVDRVNQYVNSRATCTSTGETTANRGCNDAGGDGWCADNGCDDANPYVHTGY